MVDRKRVLISDEDEDTITMVSAILSGQGFYEIITANDGLEAYRKARNQKFDFICTDFKMSKLSGTELVNALRESTYNKHTPLIIITKDIAEAAKGVGSDAINVHFLEKPISDEKLLATIEKMAKKINEPIKVKPKAKLDVGFVNPFITSTIKTIECCSEYN